MLVVPPPHLQGRRETVHLRRELQRLLRSLLGLGASAVKGIYRINADGTITGLPYLYGYLIESADKKGGRILSYLQGQQMRCSAERESEWVTAWGIFEVTKGAESLRFFLNQAERKDVPQNGSAARFDELGLYIFATEDEAREFVKTYKAQKQ